ncbi:hypothetical protein EDB19DRAFT_1904087 [Suillus lakei]|nr:hypothetical protein EDB19DRAFT_1904087 [Suillus lakei]
MPPSRNSEWSAEFLFCTPLDLRQYFEYLAGSTLFMHALKTRSDLDVNLLTFGDDSGLAKNASHLKLLATRNPGLVPESLKEALSGYSLQHHRKRNVAYFEKQTIAKALAATGIIKVVIFLSNLPLFQFLEPPDRPEDWYCFRQNQWTLYHSPLPLNTSILRLTHLRLFGSIEHLISICSGPI